tara:strand:- start:1037 stop:1666 length:630 start_codon:yes stop_codon:yes gene_type:complete
MKRDHDNFWFTNLKILFNKERLTEFFPNYEMTLNEKLNAISRLSIYLGILLTFISNNYNYMYITVIVLLFTVIIFKLQADNVELYFNSYGNNMREEDKECTMPTQNNPFMNHNILVDKPTKLEACKSYNNENVKEDIEKNFNLNLYRDVSDLYQRNNSQRQYYTMPSTTIPNDQTKFAKWCYNTGKTCKEETIKCSPPWSGIISTNNIN